MSSKKELEHINQQIERIKKIKQVKDARYHKGGEIECYLDYGYTIDAYNRTGERQKPHKNTRDFNEGIVVTFHPIMIRQSAKDTKARRAKVWRKTETEQMYLLPLHVEYDGYQPVPFLIGGGHMHMGCLGSWQRHIQNAMRRKDYVNVVDMLILYMQFGREAGYPTTQFKQATQEEIKQYFAR